MASHNLRTEPVGHTCPDIDAMKTTIADVAARLFYETDNDLDRAVIELCAGELLGLIDGKKSDLEVLRSSNSALREWGEDMLNAAEDYKAEASALESRVSVLEDAVADLKQKIEEMQETVYDL